MNDLKLIGLSTGYRRIHYNWRDVALYALGVGAGKKDLLYTYEKGMKAIPTYGTIPVFCAVNIEPQVPRPDPAVNIVRRVLEREKGGEIKSLHMGLEFLYHRPIDPIKGTFVFEDKVERIYDWGEKGVVVQSRMDVYDEAGQLLCTNISRDGQFYGGGFGGVPLPKSTVNYPEREPDIVCEEQLSPVQNVLYRLSGDTNAVHIDPVLAKEQAGQPWAFMQGLCTYGFACRMLIEGIIPGKPEQMKRMNAQMRAILLPEDKIRLEGWYVCEKKVVFRLKETGTGKVILGNGEFEWEK